jgi:hypothetical protein
MTVCDHSQENVMNAHGNSYSVVVVHHPKRSEQSILSGQKFEECPTRKYYQRENK